MLASAAWAQERTFTFERPAEPLADALRQYGKTANRQLIFSPDLVRGRQARAVQGRYSADEALTALLDGTELTWRRAPAGGIMIVRRTATSPPAPAAASAGAEPPRALEEVVVTGTHIRDSEVSVPVLTIDRRAFEEKGYLDAAQALRDNPINFGGGLNIENAAGDVPSDGATSNRGFGASANLRGLGPGATLVLLNGNRLPAAGQGIAADLSVVPAAAIQRIDVLAEGASAIYGADAVAGVVNIITRRDYDGVEVRARYGGAEGGLTTVGGSLLAGFGGERASAVVGIDRLDQSDLASAKRSRAALQGRPSNIFPDVERASYFASGRLQASDALQFVADGLYMQRLVHDDVRTAPNGLTRSTTDRKISQYSLSAGALYEAANGWVYELHAADHRSLSKIDIRSGRIATPSLFRLRYDNRLRSAEARASGDLVALPAGEVQLAVGAAYREEDGRFRGQSDTSEPSREVWSGYAEANVPLFGRAGGTRLVLTGAARVEDYSDFGTKLSPKVGAYWTAPARGLTLSANYSESFRAPSAFDRTVEYAALFFNTVDTTGPARELVLLGTGRDVGPETARNFNATATFTPPALAGLRLSATYYDIDYKNRIALPDPPGRFTTDIRGAPDIQILRNPSQAQIAAILAGAYAVQARPGTTLDPTLVTIINDQRPANITATSMRGLQLEAAYATAFAGGELNLYGDATHLLRFIDRSGTTAASRVDTIFSPSDWRARAGARWAGGPWTLNLQANYVDNYVDNRVAAAPLRIKALLTFDGSVSYAVPAEHRGPLAGARATLSVVNLFDVAPPRTAPTTLNRTQWDPTNASVIGRFVSLELSKSW